MKRKLKSRTTQLLPMHDLRARPCEVDGRPAFFHLWIEEDQALLRLDSALMSSKAVVSATHKFRQDRIVPAGFTIDVLRETFALVEYKDGTMDRVKPEMIRFTDTEVKA